ncbi:SUMO-specific isopeptidase USPL1, partial [Clarias magur]
SEEDEDRFMLMLKSWRGDPSYKSEWNEGPMNGEGCDLSVPSPALAGYLGNAENTGVVSGACPWCSAKGQLNVLRSYAFNFKESIMLCTSPLCLFPLVSGPLDSIRAILSSSQDIQGCKRKFCFTLESTDHDPSPKHRKKEGLNIVSDVKCQNLGFGDCRVSAVSVEKKLLINDHKKQQEVENAPRDTEAFCINSGDSGFSNDAQMEEPVSSSQANMWKVPSMDVALQDYMQMVPTWQHLFWKNKDNLSWLDSMLVALVHSRILREASYENVCLTDKFPCKKYTVKNLCATYKTLYAYIKSKEQQCQDSILRLPFDDLQKVEQELEALRMSVFQFMQPKLQCELGLKETPVFALPLLLKSDDWAYCLFQHTGQWEFRCTCCGYNFSTSIEKTVTTFTHVMADWHPLRAVHTTQCSNCHNKNQKRKLVLQRISSVLVLHFMKGLPRRDLSKYAFDFQGTHYNISTIIQYNEQHEHFVTWIHQPD